MRFILIAAKQLDFAKTRLAGAFAPGERRALAEAMFRDVLAAAAGARAADHVAVVTSDGALLDLARSARALTIDEEFPRGLNAAVALATRALIAQGADTVCTVLSGVDAGASGRLIGAPVVGPSPTDSGASRAILQQVKGMVGGVLYLLLCTVNTSDNQVLTLYAHQLCQVPA